MTTAMMELASRRSDAAPTRSRFEMLREAWSAFRRYRQTHRAIHELRAMADWQLRDIGIHRSEIPSVVAGADSDLSRRRRGAA